MTAINTLIPYGHSRALPLTPRELSSVSVAKSAHSPTKSADAAEPIVITWRKQGETQGRREKSAGFWAAQNLDELAVAQRVLPTIGIAKTVGIWPQDELNDGFESAVRLWRDQDVESRE